MLLHVLPRPNGQTGALKASEEEQLSAAVEYLECVPHSSHGDAQTLASDIIAQKFESLTEAECMFNYVPALTATGGQMGTI